MSYVDLEAQRELAISRIQMSLRGGIRCRCRSGDRQGGKAESVFQGVE
jgi:hypothetical protein